MLQDFADRFGVSVYVVYGAIALVVLGLVIWLRRVLPQPAADSATPDAASVANTGIANGPWSTGAQTISTQPNGTSPQGGADSVNPTGSGFLGPPTPAPATSQTFIHPTPWPTQRSTLSGIASYYQVPLSTIEAFPENQYIKSRSSWNLIYTSDAIRIR